MAPDQSILDKSGYILSLTTLLFKNLAKRFERPWDVQIADDILTKLAQFLQTARLYNYIGEDNRCRNAAYRLCATYDSDDFGSPIPSENQDVEWVYATVERLHDVQRPVLRPISYLLLVLFICRPIHGKPSAASLRMILSSFPVPSSPGPSTFRSRIRRLALRIFFHADRWFSDDKLGPILEEESVWPSFARSGTTSSAPSGVLRLRLQLGHPSIWISFPFFHSLLILLVGFPEDPTLMRRLLLGDGYLG
ncbi:hypothetical protein B0H13DRAFT_1919159 [Mycena leptocephala]|nr:hypothetical protein B0H13DRAFT_1919159 [Mycena leptocephala]